MTITNSDNAWFMSDDEYLIATDALSIFKDRDQEDSAYPSSD